jgi:hypothetical protein
MKRSWLLSGIVLLLSLFGAIATGCSSGSSGGTSEPPTFTNVYTEVLGVSCGATGLYNCHGSDNGAVQNGAVTNSSLDFSSKDTAYSALYNVKAMGSLAAGETATLGCGSAPDSGAPLIRVVPGDAKASLLYEKVENPSSSYDPPCGERMPLPHDKTGINFSVPFVSLSSAQISLIEDWINAGAQNN